MHEGLGVKDPMLMNISLGAKLLWRLLTGKNEWWKKTLLFKYFSRDQLCSLDKAPTIQSVLKFGNYSRPPSLFSKVF
jgi:hypothetical protein